jgi:glutamate N-acetyltransferase / amino-acid N-acetyltransferase
MYRPHASFPGPGVDIGINLLHLRAKNAAVAELTATYQKVAPDSRIQKIRRARDETCSPSHRETMPTGVTLPEGFQAAAVASGIYADRPDLAILTADVRSAAAGVFTTNKIQAAPVVISREHLRSGFARAIVVNAGCANACTGQEGLSDARRMAALAGAGLGCSAHEIIVASTGVIGVTLPMAKIEAGIEALIPRLSSAGGGEAARAIMTTDTRPKEVGVEFRLGKTRARIGGMAKGSGMIAPRMATMLAFLTTDVHVDPKLLGGTLSSAAANSFNRITVDGDTSTNDMAVILAGGRAGAPVIDARGPELAAFQEALEEACRRLSEMIVRDGEGATKIAEVRVEGAATPEDAERIARTIAESPLVKTALHGGDPNWGRILAAAGRSGVEFDAARVDVFVGDIHVAAGGAATPYDESLAARAMNADPVVLRVRLNQGTCDAWMLSSDLSRGYIDINSHYRS